MNFRTVLLMLNDYGWQAVLIRFLYTIYKRIGLLAFHFPKQGSSIPIDRDRILTSPFFVDNIELDIHDLSKQNVITFPKGESWTLHPDTQYRYSCKKHWTFISELTKEQGDIKVIWNISRFEFLYDAIRYSRIDEALHSISDWIKENPTNCGPNWICSQEIGLRCLHWTYFIKSQLSHIPPATLQAISDSIYSQAKHINNHLFFSRWMVRNHHRLTEAVALYTVGVVFPYFNESEQWRIIGKRIFEEEIEFQLLAEGTYIQHSMNYHRVVVQLLSWMIALTKSNRDTLSNTTYQRANAIVNFFLSCICPLTGHVPNYGPNDGALFFPFEKQSFTDFRPQITTLATLLSKNLLPYLSDHREKKWYGIQPNATGTITLQSVAKSLNTFPKLGYTIYKDIDDSSSFIRCTSYTHRPYQADMLHLDLFWRGKNLLHDAGTYSYNHQNEDVGIWFESTEAHNTISIPHYDQMLKGPRFLWFHWIRNAQVTTYETATHWIYEGEFEGYYHLQKMGIKHKRKITKVKGLLHWQIEDWVENLPIGTKIFQNWHTLHEFTPFLCIQAFDKNLQPLPISSIERYKCSNYHQLEPSLQLQIGSSSNYIQTHIRVNEKKPMRH